MMLKNTVKKWLSVGLLSLGLVVGVVSEGEAKPAISWQLACNASGFQVGNDGLISRMDIFYDYTGCSARETEAECLSCYGSVFSQYYYGVPGSYISQCIGGYLTFKGIDFDTFLNGYLGGLCEHIRVANPYSPLN